MSWRDIALVTAVYVAFGAAVVIVLWPTERTGERFLRRWGIAGPSRQQSLVAARYLRVRRLLYVLLFAITPPAVAAVLEVFGPLGSQNGMFRLFITLVAALLLAETVGALRQVRGVRVAVLARRSWRDLVPVWALALLLGLAALALVLAGICLAAQPWADHVAAALPPNDVPTVYFSDGYRAEITHSQGWLVITGTLLSLAAVLGLVRLAVRRHAVADPGVDAVLRARTARVIVGIGIAWLAHMSLLAVNRIHFLYSLTVWLDPPARPGWLALVHSVTENIGFLLMLVAVAGWIWVTSPPQHARHLEPAI